MGTRRVCGCGYYCQGVSILILYPAPLTSSKAWSSTPAGRASTGVGEDDEVTMPDVLSLPSLLSPRAV